MADTDYSKKTNAEIDRLVAEKVMGWHSKGARRFWWDATEERVHAEVSGAYRWSPTTNAEHYVRLLGHLWESGRFDAISEYVLSNTYCQRGDKAVVVLNLKAGGQFDSDIPIGYDPIQSKWRALCEAALKAYKQDASA